MSNRLQTNRPLHVCYFGTYREAYVRNEVLIAGLRQNGVEVSECHSQLWRGVSDRVMAAGGGWRRPQFWWRVLKAYIRLWWRHIHTGDYDIMLVGYPGQFDVYMGRLLSWWRGVPMVLDVLMSLHLIAEERGLTKKSPLSGKLIFWLEKGGLHLPNLLLVDTPEYEEYYCQKYNLDETRFAKVPLGVNDRLYYPRLNIQPDSSEFRIIYYGTFIPLHGVETMIRAAHELRDDRQIQFYFFGDGQERPSAGKLVNELKLENVHFQGWISKRALPLEIARSHLCLGVFGTTKQSRCTIQNKIWEGMMMQRPVITGDAETIRQELSDKRHVYLVKRADAKALAKGIQELKQNPDLRRQIAESAFLRVQENTVAVIGLLTKEALKNLVSKEELI